MLQLDSYNKYDPPKVIYNVVNEFWRSCLFYGFWPQHYFTRILMVE